MGVRGATMNSKIDFPLPTDLPRPSDDGTADHLIGMRLPNLSLRATGGRTIQLEKLGVGRTVIYCYPMTGVPGTPLPEGWDLVPGARGCTPQACNFRDRHKELTQFGVAVYGLSTQSTEYQREMAERNHLPFEILSDSEFRLCDALRLPTFTMAGTRLLKRLTLIIKGGEIEHVFYPVFPSNESADRVIEWLKAHPL
jgi:peroxiredoxin